jgi:5-deoxy-glucuronate isomerase
MLQDIAESGSAKIGFFRTGLRASFSPEPYVSVKAMNLHIPSPGEAPGIYPLVTRGRELKHLSFTVVELGGDLAEHAFDTGDEEVTLNFFTGPVRVDAEGASGAWGTDIPARPSLQQPHQSVFLPPATRVRLRRTGGAARITVSGALGKPGGQPTLIAGADVMVTPTGKDAFERSVYTYVADNIDAAHLIVGETVSRSGGWTSCPPHKHDRFRGATEVPMEEFYYFQVDPGQGFGFMRVYTDPDDADAFSQAYVVQQGDTVLVPRGYHPVASCPGYRLTYLWVLAGEGRTYGAWSDDPRHSWIKG